LAWNAQEACFEASLNGAQQSSRLGSMHGAQALLILPSKTDQAGSLAAGAMVQALML
jgi:hypothetical protein